MEEIIVTAESRDIRTVTTEIKTITRQAQQMMLTYAVEIGRRLMEAKELVPHGEWGTYIQNEVNFSQSTADNFMRLFKEYGNQQESLFSLNSQAIENLTYTKALQLLAIPAEERAGFVERNNVAEMSTRELDAAIKARDEAIAAKEEAESITKQTTDELEAARNLAESRNADIARLEGKVKELEDQKGSAASEVESLKAKLKKAKDDAKAAKEAATNPAIPESTMEKLRAEAEAQAAEKAAKDIEKAVATAQDRADKAENEAKLLREKLEAAEKKARLSSEGAAEFSSVFKTVQADFGRLLSALKKVEAEDHELATKFTGAIKAVLSKWSGEI
jgi:predicted  nucleic acid-binding Zn-ribbon protein